ncbi:MULTISPECIES: trehalose-phosphatase [unclassified Aureimonas]|uniref:trehalose-phosphatase n=1 Tax=unclassified Aureimonas TaxID=2615206 RepID=UPI0006F72558|nr:MULTISPECIES: trehalose-phosphatase [unclassified Aureimonas]KQT60731.1 trehalose phosphatase [Aureimonas sp. Leaf460]KQT68860.1 trehalose phosphatase [Aureimonas sp. Leaf427]
MATEPVLDTRGDALFLDFDGTLVGFCDDPAAVRIDPDILNVLADLQARLSGALAIVSGRRIVDLDGFLAPLAFTAAGVHGLEQRGKPGEEVRILTVPGTLDPLRRTLHTGIVARPGLELEDKGTALVLHTRRRPELGGEAMKLMKKAVGDEDGFVVMKGKDIVEVHLAGMDKGRAVAMLSASAPFAGRRPVYIGDDATDEFALAHVRKAGGVSIKVGPGETIAEHRLDDVEAVHEWLTMAADVAAAQIDSKGNAR